MTTAVDPYTMDARLCEDDGMVRGGIMHAGTDYFCTGSAHFAGQHIRCTNPRHFVNPPPAEAVVHCRGCRCSGQSVIRLGDSGALPPWGYRIE